MATPLASISGARCLRAVAGPVRSARHSDPVGSLRCFVLAMALVLPGLRVAAADTVESVHRTAIEWVKLREEKARVERDWAQERDLIQATIPALQERLQQLEDKRKLTEEQTANARRETEQEAAKGAALFAGLEKTNERLRQVSRELLQLRGSLPPRLNRALELAFGSLGDESLGPADRMRAVITVLDRCAQFNGAITFSEEALVLDGSKEKVVEVLYWGLAQGYALDRATNQAYVGRPGATGWTWELRPEAASKISAAITIHRDEAEPRFVMLPAKIDGAPPAAKVD
jgi:Skp family chaperone for outer membrane proteins